MAKRVDFDPSVPGIKCKMLSWLRFSSKRYPSSQDTGNSNPEIRTVPTLDADRLRPKNRDRRPRSASSERCAEVKQDNNFRRSLRYRDKENAGRKSILKYSSSNLLHSSGDERKVKGHITFDEKLLPRTSTTLALVNSLPSTSSLLLSPIVPAHPKVGCQLGCPVSPDLKTICSECLYRDSHKTVAKMKVQRTSSGQAGLRRLKLLKENQEALLMADDEASLVSTFEAARKIKPGRFETQNNANLNRENGSTNRNSKTVKKLDREFASGRTHTTVVPKQPEKIVKSLLDNNGHSKNSRKQVTVHSENKPWYDIENSSEKKTNSESSFSDLSVLIERAVKESLEKILAKSIFPIICSPNLAASILTRTTAVVKNTPRSRPLPLTPKKGPIPLYENIESLCDDKRSFSTKSVPSMLNQYKCQIHRSSSLPAIRRLADKEQGIATTSTEEDTGNYVDLKLNHEQESSLYVNVQSIGTTELEQQTQLDVRGEASGVSLTSGITASDSWEDTPPEFSQSQSSQSTDQSSGLQQIKRSVINSSPGKKSPAKKYKHKAQEVLCGKAKLKLQMYTNNGLLTIHVIRASQLASNRSHQVNAYVKISLEPDANQIRQWRSKVVRGASSPLFNQKISIEVSPEDENKRLLFSLWHRDVINKRSEFLGCMTFGLGHILRNRQVIHGWYRVLTLALGSQKHFAVNKPPLLALAEDVTKEPAQDPCISKAWLV